MLAKKALGSAQGSAAMNGAVENSKLPLWRQRAKQQPRAILRGGSGHSLLIKLTFDTAQTHEARSVPALTVSLSISFCLMKNVCLANEKDATLEHQKLGVTGMMSCMSIVIDDLRRIFRHALEVIDAGEEELDEYLRKARILEESANNDDGEVSRIRLTTASFVEEVLNLIEEEAWKYEEAYRNQHGDGASLEWEETSLSLLPNINISEELIDQCTSMSLRTICSLVQQVCTLLSNVNEEAQMTVRTHIPVLRQNLLKLRFIRRIHDVQLSRLCIGALLEELRDLRHEISVDMKRHNHRRYEQVVHYSTS